MLLALALAAQSPPPIVRAPTIVRPPNNKTVTPPPVFVPTPTPDRDVRPFSTVQNWSIMIDDSLGGGCFAMTGYDEGTVLRVGFNPLDANGYIIVGNEKWRSIEAGKDYALTMRFDEEAPWNADAVAFTFPQGRRRYLAVTFDRAEFLDEFMTKTSLYLAYRDRQIAHLYLRGSYAAGEELVRCQQFVVDNEDPFSERDAPATDDPFAPRLN